MRRPVRVVGLLAATLLVLAACSSAARTSPNTSPSPSAGSKADSAAPVTDPGPRTPCPATPSPPPGAAGGAAKRVPDALGPGVCGG